MRSCRIDIAQYQQVRPGRRCPASLGDTVHRAADPASGPQLPAGFAGREAADAELHTVGSYRQSHIDSIVDPEAGAVLDGVSP